jgi:hypothetical protein
MSDGDESVERKRTPPADLSPEMRRGVSRRTVITEEFGKATLEAVKQIPTFAPLLKVAARETDAGRDERLVKNLWQLLMGREPKEEESRAGLDVILKAKTPEEKGDGLVDLAWALMQTAEFETLNRPDRVLIFGFYRIALDRDPTDAERAAALAVMAEATEPGARTAALEGLFTGLLRSGESVLRKASPLAPPAKKRWGIF